MSLTMFWIIVLGLTILGEVMTLGNLVTIWFTFGALAALLVNVMNLNLTVQIIVFSLVSIASLVFVRPMARRILQGTLESTNADRFIGKVYKLDESITTEKWGLVDINGTEWSATTANNRPISKGSLVEVERIEGVKLIVKEYEEEV